VGRKDVDGQQFIDGMEYLFTNWTKPKHYGIYSVKNHVGNFMPDGHAGFEIPKIDKDVLSKKIEEINL
jgi:hypothetical protein